MRRLNDQDGAIAVIVAISLVALFGIGALVIDVARMHIEVRELQNGADAAALAVAWDCSAGSCGDINATAASFANANARDGSSDAQPVLATNGPNSVTVTTTTRDADGNAFLTHIFAGVLGFDTGAFTRTATAIWGSVGGGQTIPLTVSDCEWDIMTGGLGAASLPTPLTTVFHHTGSGANGCHGPAGQDYPGGFGWLQVDGSGTCTADVNEGAVGGDTGSGPPVPAASTGCTSSFFNNLVGRTVLMPIFTEVNGVGSNATYEIVGFGALEVHGYRFGGSLASSPAPCGNPNRCIRGRFVDYIDVNALPTSEAADYGVTAVGLIQ